MKYVHLRNVSKLLHNFHSEFTKTPIQYSIEHIVPQSYVKHINVTGFLPHHDMHNIILYPIQLNINRNNYKIVDETTMNYQPEIIQYMDSLGNALAKKPNKQDYAIKDSIRRLFYPLDMHKGQIARTCAYMCVTYPYLKYIMTNFVFDYQSLLEWNEQFPPGDYEAQRNQYIAFHQKNENLFIRKPELIDDEIFSI